MSPATPASLACRSQRWLAPGMATGRHPDRDMVIRHISQHHRIGTNHGMVAHPDRSEQLGARTDVHMTSNNGSASCGQGSQSHLLKDDAVGPDSRIRMDHHPGRMGQHQSATQLAIERDIGPRDSAPEAVPQHSPDPPKPEPAPPSANTLIVTDARKQTLGRTPFARPLVFTTPLWFGIADHREDVDLQFKLDCNRCYQFQLI